MRKVLSLDLRERIVTAYDSGGCTREDVAKRFRVSVGMVKKLLQQRRQSGDLAPRYHRCGGQRRITVEHEQQLRKLLGKRPDLTLVELRAALELDCTIQAIHYVLARMNLTYKKRHSAPASRIGRTSRERVAAGGGANSASTRRG